MGLKRVLKRMYGNKLSRSDGQAMVEFALALPVVALLIFGVLQFGRAFQIKIVLENAAREGAYYFFYNQDDQTDSDFDETRAVVIAESANPSDPTTPSVDIVDGDIDVYCINDAGSEITSTPLCPVDSTVVVHIIYPFPISVFGFVLDDLEMESEARMLVP